MGHEPFAVLLGDDLIDPGDPLLTRMIDVRNQFGGSVVALMEVDPEEVYLYGCAAIERTGEDDVVMVTDLVEKPSPEHAPSRWIIIGRYVCDPEIFDVLRETPARAGRRDPAHRRAQGARAQGRAARGAVQRASLRHR